MVGKRLARLQGDVMDIIPRGRVNAAVFRHTVITRNAIQAVLFNIRIESSAGTCKRRYKSTVQCTSNVWKQRGYCRPISSTFPPTEHTSLSILRSEYARSLPILSENEMAIRIVSSVRPSVPVL